MRIRLALALTASALLVTLGFAGSASASSSDGSQVSTANQCDTSEFGTICIDDHIVSTLINTPSGNTVIVGHTRFDISFVGAGGACSIQRSGLENFHSVFGPRINESSDIFRQEYRFPTACTEGDLIVCDTVMHYHQVNGIAQFQRSTAVCTQEPAA